jgi:site-specific DNA-methyltransferase (adenine-specific)
MLKKVSELHANKFNSIIYGNEELPADFLADISKNGILVPLSVKKDGTIISGHRRWKAAIQLELKNIPVNIISYADINEEKEAIISFNNQREKTFSQRMKEAEQLEIIEKERAKERKISGKSIDHRFYLTTGRKGRTSDTVAEKIGLGKRTTYEKATRIWEERKKPAIAEMVKKIDAGQISIHRAYEEVKRSVLQKNYLAESKSPKKLLGKYSAILCDLPWEYRRDNTPINGGVPYKSISKEELGKLPVHDITATDCSLFMWTTWPKLEEALFVIEKWGFTYITNAFVWVKLNPNGELIQQGKDILLKKGFHSGMGSWTNSNTEFVLFAKKGSPRRMKMDVKQIICAPRGEHSAKPQEIHDRIVELIGNIPRLEICARKKVAGWDQIGFDIDGIDLKKRLKQIAR